MFHEAGEQARRKGTSGLRCLKIVLTFLVTKKLLCWPSRAYVSRVRRSLIQSPVRQLENSLARSYLACFVAIVRASNEGSYEHGPYY